MSWWMQAAGWPNICTDVNYSKDELKRMFKAKIKVKCQYP